VTDFDRIVLFTLFAMLFYAMYDLDRRVNRLESIRPPCANMVAVVTKLDPPTMTSVCAP
jgi:hypothetical protein